jgi:C_GCAxxG_C_C family probable redox protein
MIMKKVDDVLSLFKKGFNCAQSLLAVYGNELGIEYETALKLASTFGGGIAKQGDTCGAVTGALMVIGLKFGTTDVNNREASSKTYVLSREFIKRFQNRHNTTTCRDLLGFDMSLKDKLDAEDSKKIFTQCPAYVENAADILEEILQ